MKNRNKFYKPLIILSLCIFCLFNTMAQDLNSLRSMWEAGKYDEVYPLLAGYEPKKKNEKAEVDYMFASSLCRCSNPEANADAQVYFSLLLEGGNLDKAHKDIVQSEMKKCQAHLAPGAPVVLVINSQSSTAGISGTKMMASPDQPAVNAPAIVKRVIPDSVLAKRLFIGNQKDEGNKYFKQLMLKNHLMPNNIIFCDSTFRIISFRSYTLKQQTQMLDTLNCYLSYFLSKYKLAKPGYMITVYLAGNKDDVRKIASSIHGLDVSRMAIGYTFADDYSIVAISTGTTISPTAFHELFHVISNNSNGFLPAWLDEGVASIYEWPNRKSCSDISGLDDWRGRILKDNAQHFPPIPVSTLVKMDWGEFNSEQYGFGTEFQVINYALARYFMMYLDDLKVLDKYFNKLFIIDKEYVKKYPDNFQVRLLEEICDNEPVNKIDTDFHRWMYNKYHITLWH